MEERESLVGWEGAGFGSWAGLHSEGRAEGSHQQSRNFLLYRVTEWSLVTHGKAMMGKKQQKSRRADQKGHSERRLTKERREAPQTVTGITKMTH